MKESKFTGSASDFTIPQCTHCRRWAGGSLACEAFPLGIPKDILSNRHDHRTRYEGDKGIVFAPKDGEAVEDAWSGAHL